MGSSPSIHDVNAERAERIAIVIQNRIFSNQSPFVEKMENVFSFLDALSTERSAGPPADRHNRRGSPPFDAREPVRP